MISLKDISKNFGSKKLLQNFSLDFESGKTHVLLGSSGSGKSTIIRIVMGLIRPNSGEVSIDGTAMTSITQKDLVRKMGYVVQEGGLFPHMTAAENVTLMARILKWPQSKIDSRLLELAHLMQLQSSLQRYPEKLSGGQRQRVGLMRALMLDPDILLLDEPLGALDPIVRRNLQNELKTIFNFVKKTVIIVTHDIGEAAFFGHTVTLINDGQLVQHGAFAELVAKPRNPFVTEFISAQKPPKELEDIF